MASLFKSSTTYDPIFFFLNAEDEEERDDLTRRWTENKLAELNFIGIVGALLAGVLTSTGSWPTILPNDRRSPWTVRACWYTGILFALAAVLTAAQQSIRLHRLSSHKNAATSIRRLLMKNRRGPNGRFLPRQAQVYMWQMSALFLTCSVLCMLGGMFILIWSSTGNTEGSWWNNDAKLAVTFTIVALAIISLFIAEQVTLYTWAGDDDQPDDSRSEIDRNSNPQSHVKSRPRTWESRDEESSERDLLGG